MNFVSTVVAPIKELVTRLEPMAHRSLILIAGFRMPGYISSAMAVPLFKSLHYSDTDIATVTKVFGFWVGLGGTFLAAFIMPRVGMMASLMIGTVSGSASHLALAWLAAHGDHGGADFWTFATAVSIDSFAYAFASIVLITYMSSLTATQLAASQFALLTSICALPGSLIAGTSGFFVRWLGFGFFHGDVPYRRARSRSFAGGSGAYRQERPKSGETAARPPPDRHPYGREGQLRRAIDICVHEFARLGGARARRTTGSPAAPNGHGLTAPMTTASIAALAGLSIAIPLH